MAEAQQSSILRYFSARKRAEVIEGKTALGKGLTDAGTAPDQGVEGKKGFALEKVVVEREVLSDTDSEDEEASEKMRTLKLQMKSLLLKRKREKARTLNAVNSRLSIVGNMLSGLNQGIKAAGAHQQDASALKQQRMKLLGEIKCIMGDRETWRY